jgi:hypothetical protein
MRPSILAVLCLVAALANASAAFAEYRQSGRISFVSQDVVEIEGARALITPESFVSSDGREISLGSLHPGMVAEVEIDDAGNLIQLRTIGVVE